MRSLSTVDESVVQFGILGALRIVADGREVALDSPKQRSLLGALLIEVGSVVSTDRLAEIMWGEDRPADPAGAVHTHVFRLRGLLAEWGGEPADEVLVTQPPGYVLVVHPDRVDAGRFERLVGDARRAPTPEATLDLVGEALDLWRGRALLGFDHEDAMVEAGRLHELRLAAFELRADAMLRLARYSELVAEFEAEVARNPFREQLHGQLIVALYRSGRQAEAFAAYRGLRDQLVGELGLEPSSALRHLEVAILQQAEDLPWPAPPVEVETAEGRSRDARHQLPEALTSFVGREQDIRGVTAALTDRPVVVLTGVGGVGKSRLAVNVAREVADDYADGVQLCDLVSADDPEAVAQVVANALGVLPAKDAGLGDGVVEFLRAQHLLLVLDNCEHVLAGVSDLVDRVARACPHVDVLVTSRQPSAVAGQQIWPVAPLEIGDGRDGAAVVLFCERASAAEPSFDLTDANREAVVEICRRLDGLPLAVELAAARMRSMSPGDLARRLDHGFNLLTSDAPMTSPRHRSVQAVIDWSYALLDDGTQRLFDRLAVFAGGFGMEAAERVCAGDGLPQREVAGRLADLVDHSLATVNRLSDSGVDARYGLLETLRASGTARLEERGDLSKRQRRHAEHFCSLAEGAAVGLQGPEEAKWVRVVDTEFGNFRAAHAWACANEEVDLALRLSASLRIYAYYRLIEEVSCWAQRALEMPGASGSPAYPAALVTAGVGCMQRGELGRARDYGDEALGVALDEPVVLRSLQLLAEIALYQGRLEDTDRRGRELVERARSADIAYYESLGHLYRVHAAAYRGSAERAMTHLGAGWQAVGEAGTPTLRAGYCYLEGEIRLDTDPDVARPALQQAIEIAESVRNRFLAGVARVALASLEARHGQPAAALAVFRQIVNHWRMCGDWVHMWTTLHNLLVLLERVGAADSAAVLLGAAQTATTGAQAFGDDAERQATATAALRAALGEQAFTAASTRGRAMSDEDAVVFALDEIDRLSAEGPADRS
ncbi:MAG: BTAD domain-containing putative transcriptional regulator [Ornithinimicrobium sp.]